MKRWLPRAFFVLFIFASGVALGYFLSPEKKASTREELPDLGLNHRVYMEDQFMAAFFSSGKVYQINFPQCTLAEFSDELLQQKLKQLLSEVKDELQLSLDHFFITLDTCQLAPSLDLVIGTTLDFLGNDQFEYSVNSGPDGPGIAFSRK